MAQGRRIISDIFVRIRKCLQILLDKTIENIIGLVATVIVGGAVTFWGACKRNSNKSVEPGVYSTHQIRMLIGDELHIGDNLWMTENLNVDVFRDSTKIIQAQSASEWMKYNNSDTPCWCYYRYDAAFARYGKFYNYAVILKSREHGGIGPKGTRIPTVADLEELRRAHITAHLFKSSKGWANFPDGSSGNGDSNYNANVFPAGLCKPNGEFIPFGTYATFWLTTDRTEERGPNGEIVRGYFAHLQNYNDSVNWDDESAHCGFFIRCIREPKPSSSESLPPLNAPGDTTTANKKRRQKLPGQ